MSIERLDSSPRRHTPPPLPSASCVSSLRTSCVTPVEHTDGRERGGWGAKSSDREKSYPSSNQSILSDRRWNYCTCSTFENKAIFCGKQVHGQLGRLLDDPGVVHRQRLLVRRSKWKRIERYAGRLLAVLRSRRSRNLIASRSRSRSYEFMNRKPPLDGQGVVQCQRLLLSRSKCKRIERCAGRLSAVLQSQSRRSRNYEFMNTKPPLDGQGVVQCQRLFRKPL